MTGNWIQNKTQTNPRGLDLPRVQARLLEMAKIVAGVLEHNGIPHIIAFGTLLGAVRHGGFIPWDSDFDFLLFEDTYDAGLEVLRAELPDGLFLEDSLSEPNYFHAWAHVKDLQTEAHCSRYPLDDTAYVHHGLTVDVYYAKRMPLGQLSEYRLSEAVAYVERLRNLGILSEAEAEAKRAAAVQRIENESIDPEEETLPVWGFNFPIRYFRCADVFPLKRYHFAGAEFWGPGNADGVLRLSYGDYMVLPPEEMRVPHYDWVKFKK